MRLYLAAILVGMCSTLALSAGMTQPAGAQTTDVVGPHNPYCGSWQSGVWTPNGNCVEETTTTITTTRTRTADAAAPGPNAMAPQGARRTLERLRGTITAVNGHMVTLQQSTRTLVVNDSPALSREDSGRVAVGRQVTAHGYWEDDTFYVTRFD